MTSVEQTRWFVWMHLSCPLANTRSAAYRDIADLIRPFAWLYLSKALVFGMMRLNELWSSDFTAVFLFILGKDVLRTTKVHCELFTPTVFPLTLLTNPQPYFCQLMCNVHANRQHCKPLAVTQEENVSLRQVTLPSANRCHSLADICVPKVRVLSILPDLAEGMGNPGSSPSPSSAPLAQQSAGSRYLWPWKLHWLFCCLAHQAQRY